MPHVAWRPFILVAIALVAALLGLAGPRVSAAPPPWFIDESKLPFTPLGDAEALWGVHAGAGYRIEVPAEWNGELVLYAHGYRGEGPELTVSNPSIRGHLIEHGYAWAASSYRENGYVPGIGAVDTHNLIGLFSGLVDNPSRVYIMGHSMGGHVTGVAIEQWPSSFAGALPMCGVMGDNKLFDYFQDVYLVAETLVGKDPVIPTPADYDTNGGLATRAAMGPAYPLVLNATGLTFKQAVENLSGGDRPIFDQGWNGLGGVGGQFILNTAGTGPGRENVDTVYQLDTDPGISAQEQIFNETIIRIEADPQFRHPDGLGGLPGSNAVSPPISGDISIPVITLHTLGELFVPFSMEQIYAERVASHGAEDLLVARAIRDARHCGFSTDEQEIAFDDLVGWVEDGVKPAGDDILDPATVAAPDFGCQFTVTTGALTTFLRSQQPACP